jgi:hypothetical protein
MRVGDLRAAGAAALRAPRGHPDDRRQVVVVLTPLLRRRARELYGDGSGSEALLERYSVAQLELLCDFVRGDRELNERRARRLASRRPRKPPRTPAAVR